MPGKRVDWKRVAARMRSGLGCFCGCQDCLKNSSDKSEINTVKEIYDRALKRDRRVAITDKGGDE